MQGRAGNRVLAAGPCRLPQRLGTGGQPDIQPLSAASERQDLLAGQLEASSRFVAHGTPSVASSQRTDHLGIVLGDRGDDGVRSEEHTSELQSRENLVCRLLLEKKKQEHK